MADNFLEGTLGVLLISGGKIKGKVTNRIGTRKIQEGKADTLYEKKNRSLHDEQTAWGAGSAPRCAIREIWNACRRINSVGSPEVVSGQPNCGGRRKKKGVRERRGEREKGVNF